MAIDGHVLDVSKFAKLHPGGVQALIDTAGKDATSEFYALHRQEVWCSTRSGAAPTPPHTQRRSLRAYSSCASSSCPLA